MYLPQPASAQQALSGCGQQIRCESEADGTTKNTNTGVFCESPDKRERDLYQRVVRCARAP